MKLDNSVAKTLPEQANLFAKFFNSAFIISSQPSCLEKQEHSIKQIIHNIEPDRNLIAKLCNDLDLSKSRGPDLLPPVLFKRCSESLTPSLYHIIYKALQTCCFPDQWKHSIVSPIFKKKGSKASISNYRPISLLNIASKIFEKVLFIDLYKHLEPMLHNNQFGFRAKRSGIIQMLLYLDTIYSAISKNEEVDVIYTDFEKAFDQVDHGILIDKLYSLGIRGKILKLIYNYLTKRTQCVKIKDCLSQSFYVTSGVPQGSILGPLFFLVMINDLPSVCKHSTSFLYADDAKFLRISTLNADFQKDLNNIFTWTQQNQIAFNASKCTHLPVKRATSSDFYFDSILIKKVSEEKDLGIIVKSDLGWTSHIKLRRGKALSTLCMLKRNPLPLNTKTKLNLFKSMVIPVLLYGSACYQLNVEEMKLLEGVQRNACKWIATDPNYKTSLQRLGILPLPMYIQLNNLLLLSKILNNHYDFNFSDRFPPKNDLANTRSRLFECTRPAKFVCEKFLVSCKEAG